MEANRRAESHLRHGDLDGAALHYREALRVSQSLEDAEGIAANAINLSIVTQRQGRYGEARASLEPVLERATLDFSAQRKSQAALRRAVLDLDERHYASAGEWAARAEAWCGRPCALTAAIQNVKGQLALDAGRHDAASAAAGAALEASRRAGDRPETANALRLLGMAAIGGGDGAAALAHLREALAIDHDLGMPRKIHLDLVGLGRASVLRGDRAAARAYYERALAVSTADRDKAGAADARALIDALGSK
jgi:tetratricopeptide (TPR) repeat protein